MNTLDKKLYTMLRLWKHPEAGTLVLFPSWLEHYTEENNTENRVTVSFNTGYKN